MQNLKPCLTALLLAWGTFYTPISFADNATSTINSNTSVATNASNLPDRSVEDLVAIAKTSKSNEAMNDAVLGNEALNPSAANVNDDDTAKTPGTQTSTRSLPSVESKAQSVDANKLILNNPVVDQANILNPQAKQRLETQLRGLYQQGLAQAAVVIVPTTNDIPIFDYALQVADKWHLGDKDIDDGLLMVVAINDHKIHILTGYGLEGVLPDAALSRIIREDITPLFKQNDYAAGMLAGIDALSARLKADPEVLARADAEAAKRRPSQNHDIGSSPSPIFLFIIAMIFGSFITRLFGRVLGSMLTAGGFFAGSLALGGGLFMTGIMAVFLWLFLIARGSGGGRGGRGGGGGMIFLPGFGGGGGGFSGGGFGGGGFGGGGGGFGGGGAGGSW